MQPHDVTEALLEAADEARGEAEQARQEREGGTLPAVHRAGGGLVVQVPPDGRVVTGREAERAVMEHCVNQLRGMVAELRGRGKLMPLWLTDLSRMDSLLSTALRASTPAASADLLGLTAEEVRAARHAILRGMWNEVKQCRYCGCRAAIGEGKRPHAPWCDGQIALDALGRATTAASDDGAPTPYPWRSP